LTAHADRAIFLFNKETGDIQFEKNSYYSDKKTDRLTVCAWMKKVCLWIAQWDGLVYSLEPVNRHDAGKN